MGATSKTTGLRAVARRLNNARKAARDTGAALEAQRTKGSSFIRKEVTEAQRPTLAALNRAALRAEGLRHGTRAAANNARLWRKHKKAGRNAFVYDVWAGRLEWVRGIKEAVRNNTSALKTASKNVAKFMLTSVQCNIVSGKGMKPNKGRYAEWKQKRWPGKPVLELSGQLRESLKPKVITDGR